MFQSMQKLHPNVEMTDINQMLKTSDFQNTANYLG